MSTLGIVILVAAVVVVLGIIVGVVRKRRK